VRQNSMLNIPTALVTSRELTYVTSHEMCAPTES
jgi:hypothetical protein